MRKLFVLSLAPVAGSAFAQFTPGNLVVSVVGDGNAITTGNLPVALRQYSTDNTTATQVGSDLVLSSGGRNLTTSYGETSEGQLSLSDDGMSLFIGGYDLAPRSGSFVNTTSPRVVAKIGGDMGLTFSNTFSPAAGDGVRDVYSPDGNTWYATGGDMGIITGSLSAGTTSQSFLGAGSLSTRSLRQFGTNILVTGSNVFGGVNGVGVWDGVSNSYTGLFETPNGASGRDVIPVSATEFYLSTSSSGTGLAKIVINNGVPSLAYNLSGTGISSITRSGNRIYALASGGGSILTTVDNGTSFSAWTTLATAGANTRFRGLEFAPNVVPEPASMFALGLGALALVRRKKNSK